MTRQETGYNFCLPLENRAEVSLLLYHAGEKNPVQCIPLDDSFWLGYVVAVLLELSGEDWEYCWQLDGCLLADPYARAFSARPLFGEVWQKETELLYRATPLLQSQFDWQQDAPLELPFEDVIMYKLHVRGFTRHPSSKVRERGTYAGLVEKIPYLTDLGITTLELMPAYEFDELNAVDEQTKTFSYKKPGLSRLNYWGYTQAAYFAPKRAYCATQSPETEFKMMIRALHKAGLECVMEFYFPEEMNVYSVMDVLRFWVREYHVDGFHLLGAGVRSDVLLRDPLLKRSKLLLQDVGDVRNPLVAEYNEGFMTDIRKFLKSDEGTLAAAVRRVRYHPGTHAVINYVTNHDGFTLADLVSYDYKHNEANGQKNEDGRTWNYSWNCGQEGETKKLGVKRLRKKQMKNAFLFMLLSQGVPLLYAGDEFGNSQQGNNNAYCQDNETGWTDWSGYRRNKDLREFVRDAIKFRSLHPILHMDKELRGMDYLAIGYPDISYHSSRAWYAPFDDMQRQAGIMYCGTYALENKAQSDIFLYVGYNFYWEEQELALPTLPAGQSWKLLTDTQQRDGSWSQSDALPLADQRVLQIAGRSIMILIGTDE
ncbi:MAG: Type II secretory pathway, pullulanase PulA and related glycosidase [Lachnospiraceae bacterium]